MEKKEYFTTLLKRDFIRYVLLREPRLSAAEVSTKLSEGIEINRLYRKMKEAILPVCDKHLSLSRIKNEEGKFITKLPEWLNPAYVDTIVADYREQIQKEYTLENILPALLFQIERLTWLQGIDDMAQNLRGFIVDIKKRAKNYAEIPVSLPDEYDLQQKYDAARRITLKEWLLDSNDDDVVAFRGAMLAYSETLCESALYNQLAQLYSEIANSREISAIIEKYTHLHKDSIKAQDRLATPEPSAEWDEEYSRIVPIDFFERNIENIDASSAFHMALLLGFARNEQLLKEKGYIHPNGELILFTSPLTPTLADLLTLSETILK